LVATSELYSQTDYSISIT